LAFRFSKFGVLPFFNPFRLRKAASNWISRHILLEHVGVIGPGQQHRFIAMGKMDLPTRIQAYDFSQV
jgi:hypothetical protein